MISVIHQQKWIIVLVVILVVIANCIFDRYQRYKRFLRVIRKIVINKWWWRSVFYNGIKRKKHGKIPDEK